MRKSDGPPWAPVISGLVLVFTPMGALAQGSPCDEIAAIRALEGSAGYRSRVSEQAAQTNKSEGRPLADPYCDGFFRAPVSALSGLAFGVQSAHLYSSKVDPRSGRSWTVVWPFVSGERVEGLVRESQSVIRGRSVDDGALYQLDAWDLTPNECDARCQRAPEIEYEVFTWEPTVVDTASQRESLWKTIDLVVTRRLRRGDTEVELVLPTVLNPGIIRDEAAADVAAGLEPMRFDESELVVVVTATTPVDVVNAAVGLAGEPESYRLIEEDRRPTSVSSGQIEPFYLPVGGWEGRVVQLVISTRLGETQRDQAFYFYVPAKGFAEAVIHGQQ